MSSCKGSQTYVWDTSKPLGQGATSFVYMGRNKKTGEEVAVKVFNRMSYQRPQMVQMREFEVMQKLKHENIVKLLAIEEESPSNDKVIVMEYCTHGSLYNLLDMPENQCGLSEDEFLRVLQQISAGVKHLRDNDIIHRDIKPGNILRSIMEDGRSVFKLTDFGASRELQEDQEFVSLYGTDEYLHPDIYERAVLRRAKGQQFGVYVDLWSLGVTFYHAATGNLPFRPYGGRKNKETMHRITTEKEKGVISGVQHQENGPIDWRRDFPTTCRLSLGLKNLVTPFLAALLDKDPNSIISFDELFIRVNDISARKQYHAFCPSTFSSLMLYSKASDDMIQLRRHIAEQTDIPEGEQVLLYVGKQFSVDPREPVSSHLTSCSSENPIFIFNKSPEFKHFRKPPVFPVPDISLDADVEKDYSLGKKCLVALHSVRNAIRTLVRCNSLLDTAIKVYSNVIYHKCKELELSLSHLCKANQDLSTWEEHLIGLLTLQLSMCHALTSSNLCPQNEDVTINMRPLHPILQKDTKEHTQAFEKMNAQLNKAAKELGDMKDARVTSSDWNTEVGCTPAMRCAEKMDLVIQRVHRIVMSFRENRSRRPLTNNDKQIHRFDKNKLKELCITAQTLLDDHCVRRAQDLLLNYKKFYKKAVQIYARGEKLEVDLANVNGQQRSLVEKIKDSGELFYMRAEQFVKNLQVPDSKSTTEGGSVVSCSGQSHQSGQDSSRREEKLGSMLDSLQSTRSSLEEVRTLLSENSSLIERMNTLPDNPDEDKSWEYIPRSACGTVES